MLQETTSIRNKSKYLLLQEYAHFHLQANKKLISRIKTVPVTPDMKDTLLHIWQVESAWFACLQGSHDTFQHSCTTTLKEISEGLAELSDKFSEYVLSLNETQMNANVHVYIPGILDCRIPRHELLQICFDQSKYHHDQIRRMITHSGLLHPPITDFVQLKQDEGITSIA